MQIREKYDGGKNFKLIFLMNFQPRSEKNLLKLTFYCPLLQCKFIKNASDKKRLMGEKNKVNRNIFTFILKEI